MCVYTNTLSLTWLFTSETTVARQQTTTTCIEWSSLSLVCTHPHIQKNGLSLSRGRRGLDHHTSEAQDCSPSCQVHEFEVNVANIPRSDIGTIVLPTTFNAGICGGSCELVTPFVRSSSAHTSLIHILTAYQKAKPPSSCPNAVFQRYCTPAGHQDLVVIVRSEEGLSRLLTLRKMIVSGCNCVEVMEFEKSSDGSGDIVYG